MAKGRVGKRKRKADRLLFVRPTGEREAFGEFQSAGAAVKAIRPIDTMHARGRLTDRQFAGLTRYSDVLDATERSLTRSCIDFSVYGDGDGLPPYQVRMNIELGRLELALANLQPIAHAVCFDLKSVSRWAMEQYGSVMRSKENRIWFEPRRAALNIAMVDLRMAGEWLAAEIAA